MALRPVTGEQRRQDFAVYDLEWRPHSLELRVVGYYDGKAYRDFPSIEAFLRFFLTRENRGKWVFAHAGGTFDLVFFLRYFYTHPEYSVQMRFSGSSAVHVEVTRGEDSWIFVDSFFLLRTGVEKIGEWIGEKKGGLNKEDRKKIFDGPYKELVEYNEKDCIILYKALSAFFDLVFQMGGDMMPTIASTAMRLFRRCYLKKTIQTSDNWNLILRDSYIASRVEVFKKEAHNVKQYDINSSFPTSMTKAAPGSFLRCSRRVPDEGDLFFVRADIEIPKNLHFPPLPYRYKGRVYYPTGRWTQWFTGVDFRLAEKMGKIRRVHTVALYDESYDMKLYVEDIYARRVAGVTEFEKQTYKLFLNALYGKFAERTEKTSIFINPADYDIVHREGAFELMPGVVVLPEDRDIAHEHVPYSATIVARSRLLLLNLLHEAKDAAYCDTDCVVTASTLKTGDGLGQLKLETPDGIRNGKYMAPKFYNQDGKIKAKGFPKMDAPQYEDLCSTGRMKIERMTRIKEVLNKGKRGGDPERFLRPENLEFWKGLSQKKGSDGKMKVDWRDKRCFDDKDQTTSRPYSVKEIEELY